MELAKRKPVLLQFAFIVLVSVAASYAFQHTRTTYQINGLCFYRYLAYAVTILLGYICFSNYKKYIGLAFSFALLAVAFSPIGQKAVELFPWAAPFLAVLMGVITILAVPRSRGRGFVEFLAVLILPAVLAESRIGGSDRLLATTESIGYLELSVITAIVVGGYFYLRYATLANLRGLELLSNGGNEKDVVDVRKECDLIVFLIVIGASGIAAFLMVTAPIVADVLRVAVVAPPLFVLALALGSGIAVTAIFYIFRFFQKEPLHAH